MVSALSAGLCRFPLLSQLSSCLFLFLSGDGFEGLRSSLFILQEVGQALRCVPASVRGNSRHCAHSRGRRSTVNTQSTDGSSTKEAPKENRGDADDDYTKALGAVCVVTVGVDGETLDECENGEESCVDDVNGGFLDPEMVREARVEELAGCLKMQVYCRVRLLRSVLTK